MRSYTIPGRTTIFVNLKGSTKAAEVPDIWYQVRKNIGDIRGTLPAGVVGPGFNDDFGDTFGLIYGFTADGFTHRELRDYVEDIRSRLLQVPDVSKIELLGAQDEQIYVEFSIQELAGLGIDRAALLAALRAQNAVSPAGALETGDEKILLRVSGAFGSEADLLNLNFSRTEGSFASATSRPSGAATQIRRSRCFASTASRRSVSLSQCGTGAMSWRSATT